MRLEQLEYLIEIHQTHSINLASQKLHVSQQNISKAIQNLESELGIALLERSNHGTYLTPAGLTALKYAQRIFYDLSALKSNVNPPPEQGQALVGELHIMHVNAFDIESLSNAVNAFSRDHPQVKILMHQKSLSKLLPAIYQQETDIGMITSNDDFHLSQVIGEDALRALSIYPLAEDTLIAAVSHTSPYAAQKSISINKLLKNPLLLFTHDSTDDMEANWLRDLLSRYGEPQFSMTTNTIELYLNAIAGNVGIGFFSHSAKKRFFSWSNANLVMLPIRPAIPLIHSYVLNNYQPISATAAAFLPYLTKQMQG